MLKRIIWRFLGTVEHRDGRPDSAHGGGVAIVVADGVACIKLDKVRRPVLPVNACSVLVYSSEKAEICLRLTGIYLPPPPTATVTAEWLGPLSDRENQSYDAKGRMISHLIVGDFNQHSWKGGTDKRYHERLLDIGAWELSDPFLPTFKTGSTLDKFVLLPGYEFPQSFL